MNNMVLTQQQKEQNKKEVRSKLIDIILEKIMEEMQNAKTSQN